MLESGAGGPVDTKEACVKYSAFAQARAAAKAGRWDGGARMVSEILEGEDAACQPRAIGDAFAYRRHHLLPLTQ